jgi:hypothetical protein
MHTRHSCAPLHTHTPTPSHPQGIKITNKDSKEQVLQILKAEQAAKMMDMDTDAASGAAAAGAADKKLKRKKKKPRLARNKSSGGSSKGSSKKAAAAGAAAPMES